MYKSKNASRWNKKIILIISLLLIVLAGILFIVKKSHVATLNTPKAALPISANEPTAEQQQQEAAANADIKKQTIEAQDNSTPVTSDKTIELSGQQEVNNTVTVFTKLKGYSGGSCELNVTNGTRVTTQTANVIYQPEFSSCAGFSVPIDSVNKGVWTLQLIVTSNGTTDTKNISLEVK